MTPGARIAAAIGVLDRVLAGTPAEACLTGWARGARYAGSGDRAAVRDHVFQALRCRRSYACLGGGKTGGADDRGAAGRGAIPDALFTGAGPRPAPLTRRSARPARPRPRRRQRMDLPDWLVRRSAPRSGDRAEQRPRRSGKRRRSCCGSIPGARGWRPRAGH